MNAEDTPWLAGDLEAVVCGPLDGIVLPKVEHTASVRRVCDMLAAAEKGGLLHAPDIYMDKLVVPAPARVSSTTWSASAGTNPSQATRSL